MRLYYLLFAMELEKLLVNGKIIASCQTKMFPERMKRYFKGLLWDLNSP